MISHEKAFVRDRRLRSPGRPGRAGLVSGRADGGDREAPRPDADGRIEGDLPHSAKRRREIAATSTTTVPRRTTAPAGSSNPGLEREDRERRHSHVQRPRRRLVRVRHRPGPRDARRSAASTGASSSSRASRSATASGSRRATSSRPCAATMTAASTRASRGLLRSDLARDQRRLRLSPDVPQRVRDPRPRSASPVPPGWLLGYALANSLWAFRRSSSRARRSTGGAT